MAKSKYFSLERLKTIKYKISRRLSTVSIDTGAQAILAEASDRILGELLTIPGYVYPLSPQAMNGAKRRTLPC